MTKEELIEKGKKSALEFIYDEGLDLGTYSKLDPEQRGFYIAMLQTFIDTLVKHKKLLEKAEESLL